MVVALGGGVVAVFDVIEQGGDVGVDGDAVGEERGGRLAALGDGDGVAGACAACRDASGGGGG